MGIRYRCDARLRCTFIVWDGDVSPEQWQLHLDTLFDDPAFPPGSYVLSDLRTAAEGSSAFEVLSDASARWNQIGERVSGFQVAILPSVSWDDAQQFVERDLAVPDLRAVLFNHVATACTWLGLPSDEVIAVLDEVRREARNEV